MGMTLPSEPSTLPKRTVTKRVGLTAASACTYISARRLVAPITEVGLTALSVEIRTNWRAPKACAMSATIRVPRTLFFTASPGLPLHHRHVLVGGGVED